MTTFLLLSVVLAALVAVSMVSGGNQSAQRLREIYEDVSGSTVLAAGDNLSATPRTLVALKAKYTTYVQRITVRVITDNAATLTFKDNGGTVVVVAGTKASPGIGPIVFDFSDKGRPLTEAKDFLLANSAAGLAADITWEAYRLPTSTRVPSDI